MYGILRVMAVILVVLALGGLLAGAYHMGVATGLAQVPASALVAPGAAAVPPMVGVAPYAYAGHWHPWGFGFAPFGFLWVLLWLFLIFALLRFAFGGRHRHGWHGGPWEDRLRASHDDWHRRNDAGTPGGTSGNTTDG